MARDDHPPRAASLSTPASQGRPCPRYHLERDDRATPSRRLAPRASVQAGPLRLRKQLRLGRWRGQDPRKLVANPRFPPTGRCPPARMSEEPRTVAAAADDHNSRHDRQGLAGGWGMSLPALSSRAVAHRACRAGPTPQGNLDSADVAVYELKRRQHRNPRREHPFTHVSSGGRCRPRRPIHGDALRASGAARVTHHIAQRQTSAHRRVSNPARHDRTDVEMVGCRYPHLSAYSPIGNGGVDRSYTVSNEARGNGWTNSASLRSSV